MADLGSQRGEHTTDSDTNIKADAQAERHRGEEQNVRANNRHFKQHILTFRPKNLHKYGYFNNTTVYSSIDREAQNLRKIQETESESESLTSTSSPVIDPAQDLPPKEAQNVHSTTSNITKTATYAPRTTV